MNPFQQNKEMARSSSNNISQNFNAVDQENKISQILSDAASSPNPQETMNSSIAKILSTIDPERQPAAIKYIEGIGQNLDKQRQRGAVSNAGIDPDLPANMQEMQYKQNLSNEQTQKVLDGIGGKSTKDLTRDEWTSLLNVPQYKNQAEQAIKDFDKAEQYYQKKEEQTAPVRAALSTAKDLRDVLENNYYSYGPFAGRINQTSDAREARQQIVTLGNSLLQNAFKLTIRNQKEFDAAMKSLTDPTSTYSKNIGAVNALEKMLKAQLESDLGSDLDYSGAVGDGGGQQETIDQNTVNEMFK